jgi:hypothetical protein
MISQEVDETVCDLCQFRVAYVDPAESFLGKINSDLGIVIKFLTWFFLQLVTV